MSSGEISHSMRLKKISLCMAVVFLALLATGFSGRVQNVQIAVDGRTIEVRTPYKTPANILRQAGINLKDKDEYHFTEDNNKRVITIYRSQPVTVEYQGEQKEIVTSKPTVGELLNELGYVGDAYEANLDLNEKIQTHMDIKIKDVPRPVIPSNLVYTDYGAVSYAEALYMEASAYLPTDGGGDCVTATGMRAQRGVVAVDPSVIPLGTNLYIPGYGMAVAADTGGAIVGDKIDLCMESYGEAINFGRRGVEVYILS